MSIIPRQKRVYLYDAISKTMLEREMQMLRAVMGKYGHGQRNAGGHYVGRFSNQVCRGHCQYLYGML